MTVKKVFSWGMGITATLLLVGYVCYLTVTQYRNQQALDSALVSQFVLDGEKQATSISFSLMQGKTDLEELAETLELSTYIENRNLGMSREYGLGASLETARQRFESFRRRSRFSGKQLFDRLAFVDEKGTLQFASEGANVPSPYGEWKDYLDPERKNAIRVEGIGYAARVVISSPCSFRGRYEGEVVGWIPFSLILDSFVTGNTRQGNTIVTFRDELFFVPSRLAHQHPFDMQPKLPAAPPGKPVSLGEGSPLAVFIPVDKSPFTLVKLLPPGSAAPPLRLLYSTAGVAVLVLTGILVLLRLAFRHALVQARLEETIVREQAVDEKNRQLEGSRRLLSESNRRLETIIETSPVGIMALDETGRIVLRNRSAAAIFPGGDGMPETMAPLFPSGSDWDRFFERLGREGSFVVQEQTMVRPGGDELIVALTTARLPEGSDACFLIMLEDVTARVALEEQLRQTQKMETVGILAGGIAHDFNNMLAGILGNVSVARFRVSDDRCREMLADAEEACMRASSLTKQLLTFSRGGAPVKRLVSLPEVLELNARFAVSGSSVRVEMEVAPGLGAVEVDEGQIGQVINNLAINAVQAMPEGGVIRISCASVTLGAGSGIPLPNGEYTRIVVSDNGPGIDPAIQSKIFAPYFTTKPTGSGLGLATVYSIVNRHGGHVGVESTPGSGATFTIHLPGGATPPPPLRPAATVANPGGGRILVVDDNDAVRKSVAAILAHIGYAAETADDGRIGVELYERSLADNQRFDAVLMDLTIPGGMGGKDAVKEILGIDPAARVIVASGYADDPILANYRAYGFCGVITKPFTLERLSETLTEVLGEKPLRG